MNVTSALPSSKAPTHNALLETHTFDELKEGSIEAVRKQPTSKRERWLLFELLCIDGEWERALQQLQTWATLEPEGTARAQLYRELIQCELMRADVFAGRRTPGFIEQAPAWLVTLLRANTEMAEGNLPAADDLREAALDVAPVTRGESTQMGPFEWLTDSDSRLGPVCEMAVAGGYRWIPFDDMRSLTLAAPVTPADLAWRPATVILRNATVLRGYSPARYPHAGHTPTAIKLGRETVWTDVGLTGVIAAGQKTWSTDRGDFGLLEIGECRFIHDGQT
jgi:type VI secretion system protein ImpE